MKVLSTTRIRPCFLAICAVALMSCIYFCANRSANQSVMTESRRARRTEILSVGLVGVSIQIILVLSLMIAFSIAPCAQSQEWGTVCT